MSEFVDCFGFIGNFVGILLSLLCALIVLLILSVMLMAELDFDVTDILGMRSFLLISLSIFTLVNGKLLLVLSTCAFDMPSESQLLSLQILPFSKFSATLINCNLLRVSIKYSFSNSSSKFFPSQGVPFFY